MKMSKLVGRRLKEFPTDAKTVSHQFLVRGGYIRPVSAGIYDILPERMDTTHYIGMWNYAWQKNLMRTEKPDYVIYLIAEWNMDEIVYN